MEILGVDATQLGLAIYVAGTLWGFALIDARPLTRIMLALLWPLGPLAFVVTVTILLGASVIAFPVFGAVVLIAAGLATWLFVL